uniref:Histidine kinase n=1 Tax=Eutreptiella gymnastica TaxID=73025 RepID=A0A7S4GH47_9EUGL
MIDRNLKASLFVAKISHELRTPLHGILGFARLLKESFRVNNTIGKEENEHVDNIASCANGNLRIVNDILDLEKLQHNKFQLENTEFDLRSCIESALATATAIPKAAKLQLGYLMPCDLTIQGDSNRLRQILLNLLSNAIKFTDEGLVTLTCQVMKMGDSMQVQFMVEDTGTGISWEDCKQLWKDFGQVGSSIAQRQCGTGLGLVISQHLLKAMGSKMEIESTPGQGSKFFFTLQCQGKIQLPPMVTKEKRALIVHGCRQQIRRVEAHCESLGMKTQAVRSLGVAQMLLRAGSMVRGRRYNCDVVLCEAALFDGRNDWVSRLNISDGPPWVVIGDLPHSLHGVSNVFAVNTSMMQRRLRERLEMVFNPNSTPSRALPDMADREHPDPTTAQPCNATPNNATPSMGMSVLSVDDVSMNQLIMGSFLKRLGAQVHLAENGRQAIEAAREQSFDVILMDVEMPVMGGVDATKILKQEQPSTPVVLVTASTDDVTLDQCRSCGADDIMPKPFNIDTLSKMLKQMALKSKRASPEIQRKVPQSSTESSTSTAVTSVPAPPCNNPNREPSGGAFCGFQRRCFSAHVGRPLTSVNLQGPASMPAPQGEGLLETSPSTPRRSVSSASTCLAEDAGMSVWSLRDMLSPSSHTEGRAAHPTKELVPFVNHLPTPGPPFVTPGSSFRGDTSHAHHFQ